jgi:hypothetical protein
VKFALAQIALYTYDTTLGIGSLLMSGVMDRFPNLKLLWSHGGGTFPYLAGRFDVMHKRMDKAAQKNVAAKTPSAYATQMSYDSIVHAPKALRFLIEIAGIGNVLSAPTICFPADTEPSPCSRRPPVQPTPTPSPRQPRRLFARLQLRAAALTRCQTAAICRCHTKRHQWGNVLSSAWRQAGGVTLSYHSGAIMDGDQKGQSGRQETMVGRHRNREHCCRGRWGDSSRIND